MTVAIIKRKWILFFILICSGTACVPTRPVTLTENQKVIGNELISQKEVNATVYEFSDRIHSSYFDSLSGLFTLQFRELRSNETKLRRNGRIVVFDPDSSKIYWDRATAFSREIFDQSGGRIFHYSNINGAVIDLKTGHTKWDLRYYLYHIDDVNNVGMGYRISSGSRRQNTLFGIDMKNGEELWRRPVNRAFKWNELKVVNDTTVVIVAGGIHMIDPRDGSGWSYDAQTGKKDYTPAIFGNVIGLTVGAFTGHYVISRGHELIYDLNSNVLIDDKSIIMAAAGEIIKLDRHGNTIWNRPLAQNEASNSHILENDGIIYMINTGSASRGYFQVPTGTKYLAAYDKKTGRNEYKTYLSGDNSDFIRDFKISGDTIVLLFKNHIEQYTLAEGEKLVHKSTGEFNTGDLFGFVGFQVFRKDGESVYYSMTSYDMSNYFIITGSDEILILDYLFNYVEKIETEELFILTAGGEDFYLITNSGKNRSVLLDQDMVMRAGIDAAGEVYRNGTKIYIIENSRIIRVDLSDL